MTQNDAAERISQARTAQVSWAALSITARIRLLRSLRQTIANHIDNIVTVIAEETGKAPHDALTGDVMVTLEHLRFCEKRAARLLRDRALQKPSLLFRGTRFTEILEPHGVALIFAPSNYPLQLSIIPASTALVAGNAVLLKCSERTPRTAALLRQLIRQSGIGSNLLQVSCEGPAVASSLIETHPDFIFFTGSTSNGRLIAERAAKHLIPCALELGGKDPALVFAKCDLKRTVQGLVYGAFANRGQVCMGTRRIYVQDAIHDQFVAAFLKCATKLTPQDIGQTTPADIDHLRERFAAEGASVHACGLTTVLCDLPAASTYFTEDSFSPVVSISRFANEEEGLRLANNSSFALAASVWTEDDKQAQRIARSVGAGVVAINDVIRNVGNPYAAFGGNKASGYGRYRGDAGFLTFTRTRSIMTVTQPHRRERHWLPLTPTAPSVLHSLLLFRHSGGNLWRRLRFLRRQKEMQ